MYEVFDVQGCKQNSAIGMAQVISKAVERKCNSRVKLISKKASCTYMMKFKAFYRTRIAATDLIRSNLD